jgi:phenylacetate-CoA ligase
VVLRQSIPSCHWATQTLGDIRGRREDLIYDTRNRLVSPATVSIHFWGFTHLKQFQFIQEGQGSYQVVVNGARGHYRDEAFVEKARIFLGEDARVAVVHLDPIPNLPSGKYALIISRYRPSA